MRQILFSTQVAIAMIGISLLLPQMAHAEGYGDDSVYEQQSYDYNDYSNDSSGDSTSSFSQIQNSRPKSTGSSESSFVTASTPVSVSDDDHVSELDSSDLKRRQASYDEQPSSSSARELPKVRLIKSRRK